MGLLRFSINSRLPIQITGIILLILLGFTLPHAKGQTTSPENTQVTVNYVYAALVGLGKYSAGGLDVQVYTLPIQQTYDLTPDADLQMRVHFPISYGRFDFSGTAPDGTELGFGVDTLGSWPGVEFLIPVLPQWTLKPFGNFGLVGEVSSNTESPQTIVDFPLNYLYLVGIRSLASRQIKEVTLSLGNALLYAGNGDFQGDGVEAFGTWETGLDVHFPLGLSVKRFEPDLNLFFVHYHFFPEATFTRFLQDQLNVKDQFEFGGSFGSRLPLKPDWLNQFRLGASYRFGGGLTAVVVNFGFPF